MTQPPIARAEVEYAKRSVDGPRGGCDDASHERLERARAHGPLFREGPGVQIWKSEQLGARMRATFRGAMRAVLRAESRERGRGGHPNASASVRSRRYNT